MKGSKYLDAIGETAVVGMRAELARKIAAHIPVAGLVSTDVPGLRLSRRSAPTECYSAAYEPELVVCPVVLTSQ